MTGPLPIEILGTKLDNRNQSDKQEQAANRADKVNEIVCILWHSHPGWKLLSLPKLLLSKVENRSWVNFSFYFTLPGESFQRQSCFYTVDFNGRVVAHECKDDYIEIQSFDGLWSLSVVILIDLVGFKDDDPDLKLILEEGAKKLTQKIRDSE